MKRAAGTPAHPSAPEDPEHLKARLTDALNNSQPVLLTPLPREIRFRLWRDARVDAVGTWLCKTKRGATLAYAWWRITGRLS